MQKNDPDLFLENNKWVSDAVISLQAADLDELCVELDISQEGHDLIRHQGLGAFESKIKAKLLAAGLGGAAWKIRSISEDIWALHGPESQQRFPRVLSWLDESPRYRLLMSVLPELDCFLGHFPGNPILAGVTQLHWAVCASRFFYEFGDIPTEVKRLKFRHVVSPPALLELVLTQSSKETVQFVFTSPGQTHSEGCLIFAGGIEC